MKAEAKYRFKRAVVNTFGAFGYLSGFMQWLWATVLYLSLIQSTSSFITDQSNTQVAPPTELSISMPGPIGTIILVVTVIVMIGITMYAIIAVPKTIVKASNKIVHKTAESVAPTVIRAQHKKDTKRTRLQLTARLMLGMKLLFIVLPLGVTIASKLLEEQFIDYSIALIVGCGLAGFSLVLFSLQYVLSVILRVKLSEIR